MLHTEIDACRPIREKNKRFVLETLRQHIPLSATFELTPRCNLHCKMCYIRLDKQQMDHIGQELTTQEWIHLAEEAIKAGTLYLLITGGEPLIREDFEEIYTKLSVLGFMITLNTNATMITPDMVKLFTKYPPTATTVTLYGATPGTYEKVCGNADGFHKTLKGLELLSKVPTTLQIRTTFIRDNVHELYDLVEIAHRFVKSLIIAPYVYKPVRGATADVENVRLSNKQIKDLIEAHRRYYMKETNDSQTTHLESDNIIVNATANTPPTIHFCSAGKTGYCISWDGKMLPCLSYTSPFTLPLCEGFTAAWKQLPELLQIISDPAECLTCNMKLTCAKCPAKFQAETGCLDQISDYVCIKIT